MAINVKKLVKSAAAGLANQFGQHNKDQTDPKLWVLMYHRILPRDDIRFNLEEPGMIVTPETFSMHMQEIRRYFDVVSLGDWVQHKQQGLPLPAKACAITFDDGWADNYEYALPILKATNTPATLFAVAEKIGTNFQFWPNTVLALLLNGLNAELNRHPLFAQVGTEIDVTHKIIDREYAAAYIARLKSFSDNEIFSALNEIHSTELLTGKLPNALMNWDQLKEMQDSGLVAIGSHTCNHMRLSDALSAEQLQHEIKNSKEVLEDKLGGSVDLFCFPNGDYNEATLNLVTETYVAAVTTKRGIIDADAAKLHELTRVAIHEEISNSRRLFGARLSGLL